MQKECWACRSVQTPRVRLWRGVQEKAVRFEGFMQTKTTHVQQMIGYVSLTTIGFFPQIDA